MSATLLREGGRAVRRGFGLDLRFVAALGLQCGAWAF